MVERPIKKSERPAADPNAESENAQPSGQRSSTPPVRRDRSSEGDAPREGRADRREGRGKGKRDNKKEEPRQGNPALMRGPKPMPPKPPVEEVPVEEEAIEVAEEVTEEVAAAEDAAEVTEEGTEVATEEATEASASENTTDETTTETPAAEAPAE
jgi:hypothetical protein